MCCIKIITTSTTMLNVIYRTIRSIFLCEGKNIKMENLLDDNYLEVSLQNLPNLAKIINPEMS